MPQKRDYQSSSVQMGPLLTEEIILRLKDSGVKGVGLSIDSLSPSSHDKFRGLDGAWERTVKGAELLNKHSIEFQFQLSVTKDNCDEVESIVEFAYEKGARAMNVFFLVCTGRGQDMTDITPQQYEKVLIQLSDLDKKYAGKMMVRGRCAPHFLRVVKQRGPGISGHERRHKRLHRRDLLLQDYPARRCDAMPIYAYSCR